MKHFNLIIVTLIVLSFIAALFVQGETHRSEKMELADKVATLDERQTKLERKLKQEKSKLEDQKLHYREEIKKLKEARTEEASSLNGQINELAGKVSDLDQSLAAKDSELNKLKSMGYGRGGVVSQPTMQASNGAGNGYAYGNCTYYVKNMRPDLPNNLGNANTWLARAQAMGLSTGSEPRVGAVATTTAGYYGHVAYVTGVQGDMVTVSEMNAVGFDIISTATHHKSHYQGYIY